MQAEAAAHALQLSWYFTLMLEIWGWQFHTARDLAAVVEERGGEHVGGDVWYRGRGSWET